MADHNHPHDPTPSKPDAIAILAATSIPLREVRETPQACPIKLLAGLFALNCLPLVASLFL